MIEMENASIQRTFSSGSKVYLITGLLGLFMVEYNVSFPELAFNCDSNIL